MDMDTDQAFHDLDALGNETDTQVCCPLCILLTEKKLNKVQGVYVYQPEKAHGERPAKRRKVKAGDAGAGLETVPFVPLLNGQETSESVTLRYNTYKELWLRWEKKIQVSLWRKNSCHECF